MKILITGNMGYIGPALVQHLRSVFNEALLVGYDSGGASGDPPGHPAIR
jgi:nucleoside-diphosphate-sugar epimerase